MTAKTNELMEDVERWDEENLALRERLRLGREMRGVSIPEMAKLARVSPALVRGVEEDHTFITHPNIAARVMAEAGVRDKRMMRHLVHKKHWRNLPRLPRQRAESVLAEIREKEQRRKDQETARADNVHYSVVIGRVGERAEEFLAFWATHHVGERECGIPLRMDVFTGMIEARGWSAPVANRMLCYRCHSGFQSLLERGSATRERCNMLAAALGCGLEDIVDVPRLPHRVHQKKTVDGR